MAAAVPRPVRDIVSVVDLVLENVTAQNAAEIDSYAQRMTKEYRELRGQAENEKISFDDPNQRLAYVQQYVRSHAINVDFALRAESTLLNFLQAAQSLRVVSIGGGPGSDVLGLLHFFKDRAKLPALTANIYDRQVLWADTWDEVFPKLQSSDHPLPLNSSYRQLDISHQSDIDRAKNAFAAAEVVTMVKFASAVSALPKGAARHFFDELFANLKPGCFVLVIDNWCPAWKDDAFTAPLRSAAAAAGMRTLKSDSKFVVDHTQYEKEMEVLSQGNKFKQEWVPYKTVNMYLIVLQKPDLEAAAVATVGIAGIKLEDKKH